MRVRFIFLTGILQFAICFSFYASAPINGIYGIEYGARAIGLGGYVAVCEDPTTLYYNPAGMINLRFSQITYSYRNNILLDGNFNNLSYVSTGKSSSIGLSASMLNYGNFDEIIDFQSTGDMISASEMILQVSYAMKLFPGAGVGGSLKYINKELDKYSSTAIALDAGFFYFTQLLSFREYQPKNFRIGVAVKNIGSKFKILSTEESMPVEILAGLSYRPKSIISFSFGMKYLTDKDIELNTGVEIMPDWYITPRAGFRFSKNKQNYTIGIGSQFKRLPYQIKADYCYVPDDVSGNNQLITINLNYGIRITKEDKEYARLKKEYEEGLKKREEEERRRRIAEELREIRIKNFGMGFADEKKIAIAVLAFEPKNVKKEEASVIADFLSTELVNSGIFLVVERENIDKVLREQAFQLTGATSPDKLVKAGRILGVQKLISGSFSAIAGTYFLTVKIVDVEQGVIEFSANKDCKSPSDLPDICKEIAQQITQKFGIRE